MKNARLANRIVCAAFLSLVFCARLCAQQDKIITSSFQPLVDDKSHVGIVVGVLDKVNRKIYSFGAAGNEKQMLDGDSVFEIGSITKVFTSLLLADMAERREINLTDPINLYLPSSVKVPQFEEKEITLLDLATHASGLPEFPSNLKPKDESNPLADYTVAQLYDALASLKLKRSIGADYEYSSFGMGLLGHILSLKAGAPYEDLIVSRICKPLDLQDTRIALSAAMRARLIKGFDERGKPTANWDLPTLAGAGALRSTANDMLKFIAANLEPNKTPLAAALINAQMPRHRARSQKNTMYVALGWHVLNYKGNEIVWHDGGTGGYTSVVCFNVKRGVGLVALSNSAESDDKSILPKTGLQALIKMISD